MILHGFLKRPTVNADIVENNLHGQIMENATLVVDGKLITAIQEQKEALIMVEICGHYVGFAILTKAIKMAIIMIRTLSLDRLAAKL